MKTEYALAASNLRIAGLSERAIYENFRDLLSEPPSYRELRAVYKERGILKRGEATERRREGNFYRLSASDRFLKNEGRTEYGLRRRAQDTPDAKTVLETKYVKAYLLRAGATENDFDLNSEEGARMHTFIASDFVEGS